MDNGQLIMKIQGVMILVFGVLALGNAFAQPLPPGTYQDLKPTQPLVLDTGSYSFIGLEMKDLGKGVWVDGRKAKSVTLINCQFTGEKMKGIGVISSGDLVARHCIFTDMEFGIKQESKAGPISKVDLRHNCFENNETAIALLDDPTSSGSSHYRLDLKCNTFNHETASGTPRKGLVIGQNVVVGSYDPNSTNNFAQDQIGGNNTMLSGGPYPNANVWPTSSDRSSFPVFGGNPVNVNDENNGWINSTNWLSIENNSANTVKYYRFDNEFVGRGSALGANMQLLTSQTNELVITGANQNPPANSVEACSNFTDPVNILFPARIAVVDSASFMALKSTVIDRPILELAVPNPAAQETRIGVYLPRKTAQAVLQILEISSGKVLQNIHINERGKLEVQLDVSKAPSGVYGYRLFVDGKVEAAQKMIVSH